MNTFVFRNRIILVKLFPLSLFLPLIIGCQMSLWLAKNIALLPLFTDNMVLQYVQNIPIWKITELKDKVIVKLAEQHRSVIIDPRDKCSVNLTLIPTGGPYEL